MTSWLKLCLALGIVALAAWVTWRLRPPKEARQEPEEPAIPGERIGTPLAASADAGAAPRPVAEPSPLSEALCPPSMAWVQGDYCPAGFDGKRGCKVEALSIGVCIDLYEYPNQVGALPAVVGTFAEAERACGAEGKRLCRDSEWTLGCRGTSDLASCWFGRRGPDPDRDLLYRPSTRSAEVTRVDLRRKSGPSSCVSAAGVLDMPGNVEEWVRAEGSGKYDGALKGGHFNKGSIGCERSLHSHHIDHRSPFVGFRCCREPLVPPPQAASTGF